MKHTPTIFRWFLVALSWGQLLPLLAGAQALRGTVATGSGFALSIHADGTLWATGNNTYGQLGLGTTTSQTSWTQVGTSTDWVQVAAGSGHALGLSSNGTVYAWGDNSLGQLGDGTTTAHSAPAAVGGGGTYTQVAAGSQHSLALRPDGTLWAWGNNGDGQLGDGTTSSSSTPVAVGGSNYTQVAAGSLYSLGLRSNGTVYAWGNNSFGQLGDGTTTAHSTPATVGGGGLYTQLAAGSDHALGLRDDGIAYAWGNNSFGQLGDGTTTAHSTPAAVGGGGLYTQLAAGQQHSAGLRADGTAYAWGANGAGQLGDGTATSSSTPVAVGGPGPYVQLVAAGTHSLGLRASGQLAAWGNNTDGQLGSGTTAASVPTPVVTGTALPTRSTAMGGNFGLAVRADGTLWAWGDNTYGQLGMSAVSSTTRAVQVGTDADWLLVAAGTDFSLALKADGRLYACGGNLYGQLGNPDNNGTSPVVANPVLKQVAGTYVRIAAGAAHSLGVQADGKLYAWGRNAYGQLANPDAASQGATPNPTPRPVDANRYVQVAAGTQHSLALRADGTAYAWGANDRGQLGNTTYAGLGVPNTAPLPITGSAYTALASGGSHGLGLRADGSVWAWGSNASGQLGAIPNGSANATPAVVAGTYAAVAAGSTHSLGRRANGTLWTWGDNSGRQLARPTMTTTQTSTPTQEVTASTGWTTLATGSAAVFTLVRTASGLSFASAGQNGNGQLGDGTTTTAPRLDRVSPLTALQPLPVQLVEFQAMRSGPATVQLSWTTASELHSAGFRVERSADGQEFEAVGFVAGAGSSSVAQRYELTDPAAPTAYYYRLAQLDQDGTASYSPTRYVVADAPALALVPNPAHDLVQVQGLPADASCSLYDPMGRPVRSAVVTGEAGLSVAGLPAGVYIVQVSTPDQAPQTVRLVVY